MRFGIGPSERLFPPGCGRRDIRRQTADDPSGDAPGKRIAKRVAIHLPNIVARCRNTPGHRADRRRLNFPESKTQNTAVLGAAVFSFPCFRSRGPDFPSARPPMPGINEFDRKKIGVKERNYRKIPIFAATKENFPADESHDCIRPDRHHVLRHDDANDVHAQPIRPGVTSSCI